MADKSLQPTPKSGAAELRRWEKAYVSQRKKEAMHLAELRTRKVKTYNKSSPEGHKLDAGGTLTLLDWKGAGQIARLHLTNAWNDPLFPRKALLKIYWDGEQSPSILCPIGDFFCDAFCGKAIRFATEYFGNHGKHWYCYLPMPFTSGCRIEIENQSMQADTCIAYDVTLEEWENIPGNYGRLHACWRRENPTRPGRAYTVLDIRGIGHWIGCNLSVQALGTPSLSFLEGVCSINVDDDPASKFWGTEDFFGGSFYFQDGPYAGPYSGCTVKNSEIGLFGGYRLFIKDAVPFQSRIKFVINHGACFESGPIYSYEGQADYSSVAYWYQTEPHDSSVYQGRALEERLPLNIRLIAKDTKMI